MSRIPLIYHTNIKFYTQYMHPMLICRGTDAPRYGCMENIYSIFKDKLLLLGEHVKSQFHLQPFDNNFVIFAPLKKDPNLPQKIVIQRTFFLIIVVLPIAIIRVHHITLLITGH